MDFYSQQYQAKRYTRFLLLYFLIAVLAIVAAVNVIVYYFFIVFELYPYTPEKWFSDGLVYYISAATILLIVTGSLFRWFKLKAGGHAVAAMVGAKRLDLHTSNIKERQLINVIEEMSIASGVPLPGIYVLRDEPGINAFVAGYLPTEAVMVVTDGAIKELNRAELQGVVAHEFSHILNGDMQINVKLMAMLGGILMISVAGRMLLRGGHRSSSRLRGGFHSSSRRGGGGIAVLGLLLIVVGYIGVFIGRIIKAAVSRQREFLADAAAVQFTRNPEGIASALNKIRQASAQSLLNNAHAEDMSHMCFAKALTQSMTSLLATHPPLKNRIERIDPRFLKVLKARELTEKNLQNQASDENPQLTGFAGGAPVDQAVSASTFADSAGKVGQDHLLHAAAIHSMFSVDLMSAVHKGNTAQLVVYALIMVKMKEKDFSALTELGLSEEESRQALELLTEINKLDEEARLPLLDLLIPSLKVLNASEKTEFLNRCEKLIKLDSRYTLYEFVLFSLLEKHLSSDADKDVKIKYYSYRSLRQELQLLFSLMAHVTKADSDTAAALYHKTATGFSLEGHGMIGVREISINKLRDALGRLGQLSPLLRKSVIEACADIALNDKQLRIVEIELLRAVAETLDCPIPPLSQEKLQIERSL